MDWGLGYSIIRKGKEEGKPSFEQKDDIFISGNIGPRVQARRPGGNGHQASGNSCLKLQTTARKVDP